MLASSRANRNVTILFEKLKLCYIERLCGGLFWFCNWLPSRQPGRGLAAFLRGVAKAVTFSAVGL
jgi:hypothetical protein